MARDSRSGVVLVAQTAIRFLTLPYLKGIGSMPIPLEKVGRRRKGEKKYHYDTMVKMQSECALYILELLSRPG